MTRALILLCVLTLVGCREKSSSSLERTPAGSALPIDHPPIDLGPGPPVVAVREVRRLNLAELRDSLPIALGLDASGVPITWMNGQKNALEQFSATLGEADFVATTQDDLEPSPLYVKFMDDAARDVCDQAIRADLAKAEPARRTLLRHVSATDTPTTNPSKFQANFRYLRLRFHGIALAEGDTLATAPLLTLYEAAARAPGTTIPREGWRAVCVALVMSPEFHLY